MKLRNFTAVLIGLSFVGTTFAAIPKASKLPTKKAVTSSIIRPGTLKIRAGVLTQGGDVKFLPQASLIITKIHYSSTREEYLAKNALSEMDYLKGKGASQELLSLIPTGNGKLFANGFRDCDQIHTAPQVPDLENARLACAKNEYIFGEKLQAVLPSYLYDGYKDEATYRSYLNSVDSDGSIYASHLIENSHPFTCTTNFDGICTVENIPPGKYFVTNEIGSKYRDQYIEWDVPVTIEPGKTTEVELSNANAHSII